MDKYPKHEHEFAPVIHQTVAPNQVTEVEAESVTWSQCRICGVEEDGRPDEAPPPKETVYKEGPA